MEASAPTEYLSVFDTDISTLHKLMTDDANVAQVNWPQDFNSGRQSDHYLRFKVAASVYFYVQEKLSGTCFLDIMNVRPLLQQLRPASPSCNSWSGNNGCDHLYTCSGFGFASMEVRFIRSVSSNSKPFTRL